jgi:hypothetical protein
MNKIKYSLMLSVFLASPLSAMEDLLETDGPRFTKQTRIEERIAQKSLQPHEAKQIFEKCLKLVEQYTKWPLQTALDVLPFLKQEDLPGKEQVEALDCYRNEKDCLLNKINILKGLDLSPKSVESFKNQDSKRIYTQNFLKQKTPKNFTLFETGALDQINDIATKTNGGVGHKAANLFVLKGMCESFNSKSKSTFSVPDFIAIPSNAIIEAVNYGNEIDLTKIFEDCNRDAQKFSAILKDLNFNGIYKILDQVTQGQLEKFIQKNPKKRLMVRSTGVEDTQKIANAGGNTTIANVSSEPYHIEQAIKEVFLSYFGEKSLTQRSLQGSVDLESQFLQMPILIQIMAGEAFENQSIEKIPVSGVIFTTDPEIPHLHITKINATYGHCEAVVSGFWPVDEIMIDQNNHLVGHFTKKPKRLSPSTQSGLEEKSNPKEIIKKPSLSQEMARTLKDFGAFAQKAYGYPLDIEFTIIKDCIYIVQCRPIVQRQTQIEPSYFDMNNAENKEHLLIKGQTVLMGDKSTAQIQKSNLIITKNLPDALSLYLDLKNSNKHEAIKCVLVEEMPPKYSHPAIVMRSTGVPVMCMNKDDINTIKKLQPEHSLIISPQQALVVYNIEEFKKVSVEKSGLASYPIDDLTFEPSWYAYKNNVLEQQMEMLCKISESHQDPENLFSKRVLEIVNQRIATVEQERQAEKALFASWPEAKNDEIYLVKLLCYGQNQNVKAKWGQFVKDLSSKKEKNLDIEETIKTIQFLERLGIFELWLNSQFYESANSCDVFEDLKRLDQKNLEKISQLKEEVEVWNENAFEKPDAFDKNFKGLKSFFERFNFKEIEKTLESSKASLLEKLSYLNLLSALVDKFDLSIKSLTGSMCYSQIKTKSENFKKLLALNYELLKAVYALNKEKDTYHNIENIKNRIDASFKYSNEDFAPKNGFYWADNSKHVGFWESVPSSGEDLFTIVHQLSLNHLSCIKSKYASRIQFPELFYEFQKSLEGKRGEFLSSRDWRETVLDPKLKNQYFDKKKAIVEYNIRLNAHSATLRFECGPESSQIILNAYGRNEMARLNRIDLWAQKNPRNLSFKSSQCNSQDVSVVWEFPSNTTIDFSNYLDFVKELLVITFNCSWHNLKHENDEMADFFKPLDAFCEKHVRSHSSDGEDCASGAQTKMIASYTPETIGEIAKL